MTDPTQTPIPPTDETPAAQLPVSDFFGGSEEVFEKADIFHNANESEIGNGEIEKLRDETKEPTFDVSIPAYASSEPEKEEERIEPEVKLEPVTNNESPVVSEENKKSENGKLEIENGKSASDITRKFDELFQMTKRIYEMRKTTEGFNLLGADNDKIRVVYKFFLGDEEYPLVSITKVETNKEDEDETIHELSFYLSEQGTALNVNLDETLLFDEEIDLQDNLKKKMQVMDKMNKFIFLLSEEARKLEKELREKEAEEQEKRKLQDIFRNF